MTDKTVILMPWVVWQEGQGPIASFVTETDANLFADLLRRSLRGTAFTVTEERP